MGNFPIIHDKQCTLFMDDRYQADEERNRGQVSLAALYHLVGIV